jgi:glycosyltransferase involved in cell wall biosynthesis
MVSIVTVTYNSAATLDDTLTSVASQTYPHIDHVLVDGGSTDGTVAMLKEAQQLWPDRVQWISEPDDGIYDAMNKGIQMARGDVIGILNSDDLLADDQVIEDVVQQLEITDADALYADLVFVDRYETDMVQRIWVARRGGMQWGWNPPHPTLYVKAETYSRLGVYRPDFQISSDYDFCLRLAASGMELTYLPRVIVKMRNGGASTRSLRSNITAFREAQESLSSMKIRLPGLVNLLRVARKLTQLRDYRGRLVRGISRRF